MPIATIGTVVRVTPGDELQIIHSEGNIEYVDDRAPFRVSVTELLHEDGVLIGVTGPVIEGPARYERQIATLLVRADDSHWETDMRSVTNFIVGRTVAYRVPEFPYTHPHGTKPEGYPFIVSTYNPIIVAES